MGWGSVLSTIGHGKLPSSLHTFILEDFLEDTHGPCFEFEMGNAHEIDSYEKSLGKHVSFL